VFGECQSEALRRRKKESKKPFIAGFVITVLGLFGLFVFALSLRPVAVVNPLPTSFPQYTALWGRYVPASAELFGFENYTAIRVYNSSYPTQYSTLLDIINPHVSLKSTSITSALTVSFIQPNESIAFAFVNQGAFNNFTAAFAPVSYSAVTVGADTMYFVQDLYNGQPQFGWIALIPADRGIAFGLGTDSAKLAIQLCLQVEPSNALISKFNVRQMLYLANGTTNHLAIGLQGFAGVIPSANNTMTVVDASGGQVVVRRILEFNSSSIALAQYRTVQQDYLASRTVAIYDAYVRTMQYEALAGVSGAVRLVE